MPTCPTCEGNSMLLGVLGTLAHLRCLACGTTFHVDAEFILDVLRGDEEVEEGEDD